MAVDTHEAIPGRRRTLLSGVKVIEPADPHAPVELLLKLRRRTPVGSVDERPPVALDPARLASEYGAEPEDIDRVVSTFRALGFAVRSTDQASRNVVVRGTVAAALSALGLKQS